MKKKAYFLLFLYHWFPYKKTSKKQPHGLQGKIYNGRH
jgi:hypothetical protein